MEIFIALLLGVILASSFFAGINISINSIGSKSLSQQLTQVYADVVVGLGKDTSSEDVARLREAIFTVEGVTDMSIISRAYSTSMLPVRVRLPDNSTVRFRPFKDVLLGISEGSYIRESLIVEDGNSTLMEDEAYIEVDSEIAQALSIGDNITCLLYTSPSPRDRG